MARARSSKPSRKAPAKPGPQPRPGGPIVSSQIDAFAGDPNFMTSLARGLAVIQSFDGRGRQVTIADLSQKTGLSRAAVRRCLYTLANLGFVAAEDNHRFVLQPRVLTLGHTYISSLPLATAAQPILDHLSKLVKESCSIAILDGIEIIYVARVNVTRIMGIHLRVGSRLPAFCTSMGRVLLADLPPSDLECFLSHIEFTPFTNRTVGSVEELRPVLDQVRRDGYALVDQEMELGLRSMAVPIRDLSGRVLGAVNVGAHAQRVSIQQMQKSFLPHLRAAAQELGMVLR